MKETVNKTHKLEKQINRRHFLGRTLKAITVIATLKPKFLLDGSASLLKFDRSSALTPSKSPSKSPSKKNEISQNSFLIQSHQLIHFYNTHTGEWLKKCKLPTNGKLDDTLKKELDFIFRDFRTNEVYPIDPKLYQLVASLLMKMDTHKPIHIVSGYRSLKSNNFLRQCSNGVARKSYHTKGKALDFFIEGITHKRIAKTALDIKKGGVGRYRSFIHIDTGPFRTWT